jgi:hypothetical protein
LLVRAVRSAPRRPSATVDSPQSLVGYGVDAKTNEPYLLFVDGTAYSFYLGASGEGAASLAVPSARRPTLETVHIVGTYDRAFARLYVNGALEKEVAATGPIGPYDGIHGLGIGTENDYTTKGTIDEAAFYDYALPAARIQAHYAAR